MMKKIFVLFLAIFVMVLFSVPVFADCGNSTDDEKITLGDNCTVGLSVNVKARYCSNGNSYAAATYNSKGTKTYGTGSGTSNIYYVLEDKTGKITDSYDFESNSDGWKKIGKE